MAMDPLAALAGGTDISPAGPLDPVEGAMSPDDPMGETPAADPEEQDKMMLIEDFRQAPIEDALAAFDALLSAFKVKRS